jgi:hypothetical protein
MGFTNTDRGCVGMTLVQQHFLNSTRGQTLRLKNNSGSSARETFAGCFLFGTPACSFRAFQSRTGALMALLVLLTHLLWHYHASGFAIAITQAHAEAL